MRWSALCHARQKKTQCQNPDGCGWHVCASFLGEYPTLYERPCVVPEDRYAADRYDYRQCWSRATLCLFSCLCSVRLQSGMQSLGWILLPNASGRTPLRATAASRKPPTGGRCRGPGLWICSCWLQTAAPTPPRAHCAACLSMTAVSEKGAGSMQTRNKAKDPELVKTRLVKVRRSAGKRVRGPGYWNM